MEKLTKQNCNKIAEEIRDKFNYHEDFIIGWHLIMRWCMENGLEIDDDKTGIENVIGFLESLKKSEL